MNTENLIEYENAVRCAFQYAGMNLSNDRQAQEMKIQAEKYCDTIKNHPQGWLYQLQLFTTSSYQQVQFYALQSLQERLIGLTLDTYALTQLRDTLMSWLQASIPRLEMEIPVYLKTKLAVIITLLIKFMYPDTWSTAFTELTALLPLSPSMVEMYFRILITINEEIVEFDAQRTVDEANTNMKIKDAMRDGSTIVQALDTIYNVLSQSQTSQVMHQLSVGAMEALKLYISWVDISLIMNDRFVPLLYGLLGSNANATFTSNAEELRCLAANCIFEIVDKGMDTIKKLELLEQLQLVETLKSLNFVDADDFAEEIGEVVNAVGLELVEAWDMFSQRAVNTQQSPEEQTQWLHILQRAGSMLSNLMPLVWTLFSHDVKDVSEEVFEFVNAIGARIQTNKESPEVQAVANSNAATFVASDFMPQILHGISRQIRYREENEAESIDAAEFEEYRRALFKIYVNITRVRPMETLAFLQTFTSELLYSPQNREFHEINHIELEALLSLIYRYKEGLTAGGAVLGKRAEANLPTYIDANSTNGQIMRSQLASRSMEEPGSPVVDLVLAIHSKMIASTASGAILHSSVLLTYYELTVRYVRVLQNEPSLIPQILSIFFGPSGLTNPKSSVRSRVCYMSLRLVKSLGASVHPFVSELLSALQPRLSLNDCLKSTQDSKKNDKDPNYLPFDDQLYLFELTGQVISSLALPNPEQLHEVKYKYTNAIVEPLLDWFTQHLLAFQHGSLSAEDAGNAIAFGLNALAHVLKAFKTPSCMANQQLLFSKVLAAVTTVIHHLPRHIELRRKVVFVMHRLITVLDPEQLIGQGNSHDVLRELMQHCDAGNISEVVMLLDQLVIKYKIMMFPLIDSTLLPFVRHICEILPPRNASSDTETKDATQLERESIQKYMYLYLLHLLLHGLETVFVSETNLPQLEELVALVLDGCSNVTDTGINRSCITIAHKFASLLVFTDLESTTQQHDTNQHQNSLSIEGKQWFTQQFVQQFTPGMLSLLQKCHFRVTDMQCIAVLKEMAVFQELMVKHLGKEYVQYLADQALPSLGYQLQSIATYCEQLLATNGNRKQIIEGLKSLTQNR